MATTPAPPQAPPKPTWDPRRPQPPFPWLRPTIRIRLTLLYGGMFLIAGILLLSIIYLLAAQAISTGNQPLFKIVSYQELKVSSDSCSVINTTRLSLSEFNDAIAHCVDQQRQAALDNLLSRSLLALLGLAVIAFAFGYAMAGRVLSPLGRITRHRPPGGRLRPVPPHRAGRPGRRAEGAGGHLRRHAGAPAACLHRPAALRRQRSHELRTPLAINRTLLEVHLSDPGAPVELQQLGKTLLATNERSEQLVEGLLLLARSDNQIVERKPVDLAEVASQAIDQVHGEAEAKGVEIRGERKSAVVQGNGVLLERIALNLVQNAVRYNVPEDGWVEVDSGVEHGQAVLTVSNTGPVVPAYEIDNLFEPFRRLRTERTNSDKGVGLGLSIVRSVTRAHGGHIVARPREGGGLVMHVTLPL